MTEIGIDTALEWRGRTVVDRDGEKVGTLRDIYLDEDERPGWASVHTGLFGRRESLVPLADAREVDDRIQLPYDEDRIKQAPSVDPDVQLSPEEEEQLHRHYGLGDRDAVGEPRAAREEVATGESDAAPREAAPADAGEAALAGEGAPGDDAMTRSEEEIAAVGKRTVPRERVRIKKYVVTDHVKRTVPVRREEVRLEHDPPRDEPPDAA